MIYLASPYSHPDPAVRDERFHAVCRAAAALLRAGHAVLSPIAHSHALARHGLPTEWSFWSRYDLEMLARCDQVVVLMLPGWQESAGVREEIRIARELGKPVRYVAPDLANVSPTLARVAFESRVERQGHQREETPPGGLKGDAVVGASYAFT